MAGNHVLLETIQLTQSAASVTFDNIPQTGYTDLVVKLSARQSGAASAVKVQFNSDTSTANYRQRRLYGNGTTAVSDSSTVLGYLNPIGLTGSGNTANVFGNFEMYSPNYSGSSNKSFSFDTVQEENGTLAYATLTGGLWLQTSAITEITLTPTAGSFVEYSTFSIYGVADVNTTPVTAPLATGGNIVGNDGTYWYHAFLSSGTFTAQLPLTCDYLVVAGGGGGGCSAGGGGGAGGYRTSIGGTPLSLTAQTYTVTVGAGGAGANSNTGGDANNGGVGSNSVFATITSAGGGYGSGNSANSTTAIGGSGGSGGGGNGNFDGTNAGGAGNTPSTSPSQGNNGGAASSSSGLRHAGGGGGAGAVGGSSDGSSAGAGGNGTANSISGTSVIYAGGGGGASTTSGSGGGASGGTGGGGTGGWAIGGTVQTVATAGAANRGAGGGGGARTDASITGSSGAGGSGIVIIRYAMV